jgi:hypothetical protein
VKTIYDSGTNIAQDTLNSRPMSIPWCMKILTNMVNCIGDIRPSDGKVLKTPNNTSVLSGIISRQQRTISSRQGLSRGHRRGGSFALKHTGTPQQILRVLLLRESKSITRIRDLQSKKVV